LELEECILPEDEWYKAPIEAYRLAKEQQKEGLPTAIAYREDVGYAVHSTAWAGAGHFVDGTTDLSGT